MGRQGGYEVPREGLLVGAGRRCRDGGGVRAAGGLSHYFEAEEDGAVELESEHEGAGGGDSGGLAPGDGVFEMIAGEGGSGEGVVGEGSEGFVLECDAD